MSEQLAGVVEGQASEGDISSRQHTLTIRFAKLGLTALTATLLLGVGGAHAICPCGDGSLRGSRVHPSRNSSDLPGRLRFSPSNYTAAIPTRRHHRLHREAAG